MSHGLFLSIQPSSTAGIATYAQLRCLPPHAALILLKHSAEAGWKGTPAWLYCILSVCDLLWQQKLPAEPCRQVLGLVLCGILDRLQAFSQDPVRKSSETLLRRLKMLITKYTTITHSYTLMLSGNRPLTSGLKSSSCGFLKTRICSKGLIPEIIILNPPQLSLGKCVFMI